MVDDYNSFLGLLSGQEGQERWLFNRGYPLFAKLQVVVNHHRY